MQHHQQLLEACLKKSTNTSQSPMSKLHKPWYHSTHMHMYKHTHIWTELKELSSLKVNIFNPWVKKDWGILLNSVQKRYHAVKYLLQAASDTYNPKCNIIVSIKLKNIIKQYLLFQNKFRVSNFSFTANCIYFLKLLQDYLVSFNS